VELHDERRGIAIGTSLTGLRRLIIVTARETGDAPSRRRGGALVLADQWLPAMTGNEFLSPVPGGVAGHPATLRWCTVRTVQ
jgi:hypothetical protein